MSFDAKSGHFILTISKARFWWKVDGRPKPEDTEEVANRLRSCGVGVHEVQPAWIMCDMRPAVIWRALGGEDRDPFEVSHYWTPAAQQRHPKWAAAEMELTTSHR